MNTEIKIAIITVGCVVALGSFGIFAVYVNSSNEKTNQELMDELVDNYLERKLIDCHFVHNPCPYLQLDKKLDIIIELLEKKN